MEAIKIAIQKSGRLNEGSVELLKKCGLSFDNYKNVLISKAANFPLEILFLRDDDIPEYVQDGIADLGIVGENVLAEEQSDVEVLKHLGIGKCSLKIAVPKDSDIKELSDLNGKSITTSYPKILKKYLAEHQVEAQIRFISGSVEIAPGLGLSDAIFDIVSSGTTLRYNGLIPFADVMKSEAVLISNKAGKRKQLAEELLARINSVLLARDTKYVVLNAHQDNLPKIVEILPGVKSPSVLPLYEDGWVAVHSVIQEQDFWQKIQQLKTAGAEGIVVMPVEKIII